jgi:hypothetical protein
MPIAGKINADNAAAMVMVIIDLERSYFVKLYTKMRDGRQWRFHGAPHFESCPCSETVRICFVFCKLHRYVQRLPRAAPNCVACI